MSANSQFALVAVPSEPIGFAGNGATAFAAAPAPQVAPAIPVVPLPPIVVAPAPVQVPSGLPVLFGPAVYRIDLQSGDIRQMPLGNRFPYAWFGMDLSDDGQTAVVPTYSTDGAVLDLAVWDLPNDSVGLATGGGAGSAFLPEPLG